MSRAGRRIDAVTLDAAGTLFTVAAPVGTTYAEIAARHGIVRSPAEVEARFRAVFRAAPPLACPIDHPYELDACERGWWRALAAGALEAGEAPGFDACFDELYAFFADPRAWRVYPDVRPALADLRRAGLRLAVVSNFDRRLGPLLAGLGLAGLFTAVVPSSVAGAAKPAAAIFHRATAALGVATARALHVGDDVRDDVGGARAAGLHAALIDRSGGEHSLPRVPVITTLGALSSLVDTSSD